eukprot:11388852-Alexandrium_andersonii.AAC.1
MQPGFLAEPCLSLAFMRGQPDGLVSRAARGLPAGPQVSAQPGSEDVHGGPVSDQPLHQPALDLLPSGAGENQKGGRSPPPAVALDHSPNS